MEVTYKAILLSSRDYKDNDKLLKLITLQNGTVTAIMRGVKKPTSKLRFGAVPFAFCEYTLYKRGDMYIVTGCTQIEDLFAISQDYHRFAAACIALEAVESAVDYSQQCAEIFVELLRTLKIILYADISPYLATIKLLQVLIHTCGYTYKYPDPPKAILHVMDLLTLLYATDLYELTKVPVTPSTQGSTGGERGAEDWHLLKTVSEELVAKTLVKLVENFEKKFEQQLKSKLAIKSDAQHQAT